MFTDYFVATFSTFIQMIWNFSKKNEAAKKTILLHSLEAKTLHTLSRVSPCIFYFSHPLIFAMRIEACETEFSVRFHIKPSARMG